MALDSLNGITQFKTGSTIANGMQLSDAAVNKYKASIEGLSLSQAEAALSATALNEEQRKQILMSAGLITSTDSVTAAEVKQTVAENVLTTAKQQEVLATFEAEMAEGKMSLERLQAIALEDTEAGAIARIILAKKGENAQNLKNIASGKALNTVLKEQLVLLLKNPLTWVVIATGAVIGLAKVVEELVVTEEELNEQIEELQSNWSELSSTIQSSAQSFQSLKKQADELIPRYAELAQGVDKYGKNVSLTDEEFSEFVSLNNQLGQMFPELVMGYDSNGNAILALSGNVDTLTESLYAFVEAQRIASAQTIADTMPEVMSNIDSTVEAYKSQIKMAEDSMADLDELYNTFKNKGFVEEWSSTGESMIGAVKILNKYGIDYSSEVTGDRNGIVGSTRYKITVDWDDFETSYNGVIAGYEKKIDDLGNKIESKWKQLNPVVSAWLSTDFLYQDLDMSGQSLVTAMVGEIDFKSLGLKTEEDIQNYITNSIISPIYDMDTKTQQAFFEVFDLHEALNKGELSVQEYQDKINAILENGTYSQEFTTIFKLAFAEGDLQSKYNDAINRFTNDSTQTLDDVTAQYQEVIDSEYQKIQDWGLGSYAQQIKDGTIQSVFGNVDMDKRTIITWSDELKQTYKDALDSWDYDPEVGGIDTVFGGSDRFGEDLNGVGWEVAFTPILPDGTFLSQDAVYDYINTILAEAYANDGKITEDELTKIDAQGRQIGNTFIHGIFAGIDDSQNYDNNGNWAETVGRLLHFSGDFGAVEIAKREKEKAIKEFSDSNVDLEKFFEDNSINTTEEIDYWNKVTEGAESAEEAVEMYNKAKGQNPDEITVSLSISETIDKLNTELKPSLDSLKDAWEDIFTEDGFTLENVDTSMLDDIKSTIDELNDPDGLNLGIDYSAFEELSNVLTNADSSAEDVKNSMNAFASSIFNSINTTGLFNKETASVVETLLESMGITNAHTIVTEKLEAQTEALALQQQFATQTGWEMQDASNSSVEAFLNHKEVLPHVRTELFLLKLAQDDFANSDMNAKEKIEELQELATAYGQTAIAARIANLERANTDGHIGIDYDKELASLMDYINNVNNVEVDYTPVTDKKSGGKDSSKEFDWIETAVNSIEKDIERLDKTIDSAYTSAGAKSEAFVEKLHKVNEEIKLQQQAYEGYMAKADSVGLSDNYKQLVQSGAINIEKIADEKLADKISEYQQWYEKAQETQDKINDLYEQSSDVHVESYEFEADQLAKLRDKNLLNVAEYYESMMNLQDQYYNQEAIKLKNLADQMEAEYGRMSNINLTRPTVHASAMQQAGYTPTVESSSVHAMTFGNGEKQVVVTPILPDGTILSPEALTNYATQLLNGEQIDANIQLAMFDGADAQKQANEYIKGLENIQGEYAKLKETFSENPYGDLTEKQLEAIEKLSEELGKIKDDLSSELGDIKSAYDNLIEIRDTYNEHGKISVDQYQNLCDMGFEYLALLSDESGALSLDEEAFQRLTDAKIQEMQVTMALQAVDLINNIETEADAIKYLAASYGNLANEALNAAEEMLRASLIEKELKFGKDSKQYQAAQTIVEGYQNSKLLAGVVDVKMQSGGGYSDKDNSEERDWAEKLLENIDKGIEKASNLIEKISDKTSKLIDKVDKFLSWQKKNAMINRAVESTDKEIKANEKHITDITDAIKRTKSVINLYDKKLSEIELPDEYKNKIQKGELEIEEIGDESLQETIKKYEEWYGKIEDCKGKMDEYEDSIQECRDAINDLYDQQRDLIRQKLDNVLDYYSDMDSYLTSITSKMESLVSLNDSMGKRSSLTELVEQFAEVNDRLSATVEKSLEKSVTEIDLGESESVKKAQAEDRQELVNSIQSEIDNLAITPETSGTYKKLLDKIEKKEKEIQKYEDKGWDTKKSKKYAKLQKELEDYYELRKELEENTTSDTIANYSRIYTAWQKLQNKIDSGKTLTKSQQKKYDSYLAQMEQLKADKDAILAELNTELGLADGSIASDTEAQKAQKEYDAVKSELEDTATYKKLESNIKKAENDLAELEKIGYENLTNKQKKTHKKLISDLEDYYERKKALDEGATASNVAEYNKIYVAWRKLQDKLDAGKNLSTSDWKKYNNYTEQLKEFKEAKDDLVGDLQTQLDEALNPTDKIGTIDREYEKASEEMYQSYQDQIKAIESELTDTKQYKNLEAKAQALEQKKKTKGLSKEDQAKLDKYNAKLEALRKGGNATNVAEYMSTWEKWYKLEQKLIKDGKLSDSNAKKYDEYKAKLEAWNKEKQTQIDDLVSLMEDDLEALQKTYTENVAEAESQISDYYKNLYDYAKQIAEYNLTTLEAELSLIEACLSYYKELVSLHDNFSGNKLSNLMADLGIDDTSSQEELYEQYIKELQNKYDTTLKKINEYKELITAAESEDYEGALTVFKNALDEYTKNGQTDMANKLQSVIDLLNTRMESGEVDTYDDLWKNEWEEALASAKTELIGIATNIQEVNDALREVKFSNITDAVTQLNNAQDVLSSIGDLINDDWVYDADGNLTQYGITKVGLLVEEINSAKQEVSKYAQLMKSIQEMQDTYASDEAYQTALQEAKMNYLTSLNDLQNYQDSVVAILTKADESIINSLKDVIAKRKEALQKQKELYDYGKNIKNSQKEIDAIQAQIDALRSLSGAMDSATKAKLAQLEADLVEKQEALQETKDDHTYNLQIDALDEFLESLDSTMSDTADSVNKSFETYIEAINSALDVYEQNKEHLDKWSDNIIKTTMGVGGDSFDNVSLKVDGTDSGNETIDNPTVSVVSSDTVNAIESTGATTNQKLDNIQNLLQTTVNGGVLVRVADSPLLTVNPEMMRLLNSYIPPIAMNVQQHLPQLASKNNQTVVNVHYDNLLTVNGNVDKDFAKVLPQHLEQAYEYTTKRLYKELNISR